MGVVDCRLFKLAEVTRAFLRKKQYENEMYQGSMERKRIWQVYDNGGSEVDVQDAVASACDLTLTADETRSACAAPREGTLMNPLHSNRQVGRQPSRSRTTARDIECDHVSPRCPLGGNQAPVDQTIPWPLPTQHCPFLPFFALIHWRILLQYGTAFPPGTTRDVAGATANCVFQAAQVISNPGHDDMIVRPTRPSWPICSRQ